MAFPCWMLGEGQKPGVEAGLFHALARPATVALPTLRRFRGPSGVAGFPKGGNRAYN
jgi:hypothetical protein